MHTIPVTRLILALCLVLTLRHATADSLMLDHVQRDWTEIAELAESRHLPVVILVSSEDCGYCERLKNEVLFPMAREGRLKDRALVRELPLDTGGKLLDFDGERIRTRIFLGRYKVFASPTLLFLDAHGLPLHEPLVGYSGPEQYRDLLLRALRDSLRKMHPSVTAAGA
jgi:thioredoxin-related protein